MQYTITLNRKDSYDFEVKEGNKDNCNDSFNFALFFTMAFCKFNLTYRMSIG